MIRNIECRYVLITLISLGFLNITLLRTNISVAIVSMVNSTTEIEQNSTTHECPERNGTVLIEHLKRGTFEWSSVDQGLVLGCYFYGYVISSIPGPWIAKKYGFKHIVGISTTLASIVTILGPLLAYHSLGMFVAGRITLGFLQGTIIPTSITAFPIWVPPTERNFLYSVVVFGFAAGAFVTPPLAGVITDYFGWEAVFYATGSYTLVWSCLWFVLAYDTPQEHPRISEREKKYIEQKLETGNTTVQDSKRRKIPWFGILTSAPVWATIICHAAYDWTFHTAAFLLPTYMSKILKFNVTAAGASSGIPYLIMGFVSVCGGYVSDVVLKRRLVSTTVMRKIYILTALLIPALFIVLASHTGCDQALAVFYFVVAVSVLGFHVPGTDANYFDLSPVHCGILFGINGALSTSMGFLAPQIAGFVLYPDVSLSKWQAVFWITAGINAFSALVYLIFGSGVEQKWSFRDGETSDTKLDVSKGLISDGQSASTADA